jgi:hypothetical protein
MKVRKQKGSLRDRLSADYLKAFQEDFAANGVAAIKSLRQESPAKYAEIASRLIAATTEPTDPDSLAGAESSRDIGKWLLRQVGCTEPTDDMVAEAVAANREFLARLDARLGEIKANGHDASSAGE